MKHPMGLIKFFSCSILIFFLACGGETNPRNLFDIQIEENRKQLQQGESVGVSIQNKKGKSIDKVSYFVDGKELVAQSGKLVLDIEKLGNKVLEAKVEYEGTSVTLDKKIKVLAKTAPEIYTYEVIQEYPHDIKAFTQGLEFHNDTLYEGTGSGQGGKSFLRKIDYRTGKVLQQTDLEKEYFGEGISILNNKVFQLTWQKGMGFVYDLSSLKKEDSFQYGQSKEGWGLCNDGKKLYKSDGTEKIWILNPDTLVEEGYIQTVTNKSIFNKANELEYVNGKIYANVWQKESMMIIDAKSGAIEGVINFGGLKSRVKKHDKLDVLNGVAYHPERKTFFVTGKNWDKLFEVRIKKKEDGDL